MSGKMYLRDLVGNPEVVEKISSAFSDLRADFELDLDTAKEKIDALSAQHVNARDHLDHLSSISKNSSGVLQGLRGTGKTHLMLLARHRINSALLHDRNLCVYVNMKRLSVPADVNHDTFNRIFAVYLYECIVSQLGIELKSRSPQGLLENLKLLLDSKRKEFVSRMAAAIETFGDSASEWLGGSTSIETIGVYQQKLSRQKEDIEKIFAKVGGELGAIKASVKSEAGSESSVTSKLGKEIDASSFRFFDVPTFIGPLKHW